MDKVIFWDFDGTLAYSDSLWSSAVYSAIRKNIPASAVTFGEVREYMGESFTWDMAEKDFSKLTGERWWDFMFSRFHGLYRYIPGESRFREVSRDIKSAILNPENYHLYGDTVYILEKSAKLGYRNYILSNNYPELEEIVVKLGISGYFEECFISSRIGYDKPRREIFEYALRRAGLPRFRLMVGDNPDADIRGAAQSGIRTALVHRDADCGADHVFENLAMLETVL